MVLVGTGLVLRSFGRLPVPPPPRQVQRGGNKVGVRPFSSLLSAKTRDTADKVFNDGRYPTPRPVLYIETQTLLKDTLGAGYSPWDAANAPRKGGILARSWGSPYRPAAKTVRIQVERKNRRDHRKAYALCTSAGTKTYRVRIGRFAELTTVSFNRFIQNARFACQISENLPRTRHPFTNVLRAIGAPALMQGSPRRSTRFLPLALAV